MNKDCESYNLYHRNCWALKESEASCKDCIFFKSREQHLKEQEKAIKRLKSLSKTTRYYIADKYKVEGIV